MLSQNSEYLKVSLSLCIGNDLKLLVDNSNSLYCRSMSGEMLYTMSMFVPLNMLLTSEQILVVFDLATYEKVDINFSFAVL